MTATVVVRLNLLTYSCALTIGTTAAGPAASAVKAGNAPESCCLQELDQNTGGETNFKDHRQEGVAIEAVGHEEAQTLTGRTLSALRTRPLLPPGLFRILNVYATNLVCSIQV